MIDLIPFSLGLSIGAAVLFLIRLWPEWRQYVAFRFCPKPSACPHHRDTFVKHVNDTNDQARRGPPRPPIQ